VNKRWRNAGLYALLALSLPGDSIFDKQPQSKETWRYSQFIQEVEKAELSSQSQFRTGLGFGYAMDGERRCELTNDPELIDILTKNNVDISVLPQSDEGFGLKH